MLQKLAPEDVHKSQGSVVPSAPEITTSVFLPNVKSIEDSESFLYGHQRYQKAHFLRVADKA